MKLHKGTDELDCKAAWFMLGMRGGLQAHFPIEARIPPLFLSLLNRLDQAEQNCTK